MKSIEVEAVICDMDGVITNTMPAHFRVWKQLFAEEGIPVSREDIYAREGQKGIESLREIFAEYRKPFTEERARFLLKEKEKRFKDSVRCRFITGARQFLRRRHSEGVRLALVTGTSRHEMEKLLSSAIRALFDVTVCGCEVQNGKPHPEPYLTALTKLRVSPKNAVVIENAPFGIRSAKAAGLKCLGLATSLPKSYLHQADAVFGSFKELTTQVSIRKHGI